MMLFSGSKSNSEGVVKTLLKSINVNVSDSGISKSLREHPDYPSLLSISDALDGWSVVNQSYLIEKTEFYKEELMFPFIAHVKIDSYRFILIKDIVNGTVLYADENKSNLEFSEKEFMERWDGVALHAEATAQSGEAGYKENVFQSFLKGLILPSALLVCLAGLYYIVSSGYYSSIFLMLILTKIIGVGITVLLIMQSLNSNNTFIRNLCSLKGKTNCNSVLKSDAARITSWLSWSEAGFFYFSGSLIYLLVSSNPVVLLTGINLLALPYTVYSIYYQYRTKSWCVLCCTVQLVFLVEFVLLNPAISNGTGLAGFSLSMLYSVLPVISFLFPILAWAFLKPFFIKANQFDTLNRQFIKFKFNRDLFERALKSQPKYIIDEEIKPITLGNPDSKNIITIVSNPYCAPCAKAHQTMEEWLKFRDDIQLKVIFSTADLDDDPRTIVSRHLSALSSLKDKVQAELALSEWYGTTRSDYSVWAAKFPVEINEASNLVTQNQRLWCDMAAIEFTPTIFFNGYKLPEQYRLEDVKYFLN